MFEIKLCTASKLSNINRSLGLAIFSTLPDFYSYKQCILEVTLKNVASRVLFNFEEISFLVSSLILISNVSKSRIIYNYATNGNKARPLSTNPFFNKINYTLK